MTRAKRIFDPIHRFIELDAGEVALLETPVMQRMRRLRQLGLAYLAYPSAEHSRFSHALGALAMGSRALDALRVHSPEAFDSDAQFRTLRRLLRASLLLHDLGHGPFSHASEAALGIRHEARTAQILALPQIGSALDALEVDRADVLALIVGTSTKYGVLRELVSGPNLDADRMDYLLRDAYFTGVASGGYDSAQLISSLRILEVNGRAELGVDGRGVVALESFVLARLWPDPRALDDIEEYLAWDDFRVLDVIRDDPHEMARALRDRVTVYGLAAEFNAEHDLATYGACERALRAEFGPAVWSDSQEQLLHRLPLGGDGRPTVHVRMMGRAVDARKASDLIAKLSGKAYWRKLFVRKSEADVERARAVCRDLIAAQIMPSLFDPIEP